VSLAVIAECAKSILGFYEIRSQIREFLPLSQQRATTRTNWRGLLTFLDLEPY